MSDGINQFTRRATHVMTNAQAITQKLNNTEIQPIHLLLGMAQTDGSIAQAILQDFKIINETLAQLMQSKYSASSTIEQPANQMIHLSDDCKTILELSVDSARKSDVDYIGTEHLLAGIVRLDSATINEILAHFNVSTTDILERIQFYLETPETDDKKED